MQRNQQRCWRIFWEHVKGGQHHPEVEAAALRLHLSESSLLQRCWVLAACRGVRSPKVVLQIAERLEVMVWTWRHDKRPAIFMALELWARPSAAKGTRSPSRNPSCDTDRRSWNSELNHRDAGDKVFKTAPSEQSDFGRL